MHEIDEICFTDNANDLFVAHYRYVMDFVFFKIPDFDQFISGVNRDQVRGHQRFDWS